MSDRPAQRSRLEKQAAKTIEADTEAVELASQIYFGCIKYNDQYADWHASTPLVSMVRALFLKELEGYSISDLHRRLETHSDDAETLGFDKVPARTTFGRT